MKESKKEEPGTKRRFRRVEGAVWQEPWEERALSRTEQPLEWTIKRWSVACGASGKPEYRRLRSESC